MRNVNEKYVLNESVDGSIVALKQHWPIQGFNIATTLTNNYFNKSLSGRYVAQKCELKGLIFVILCRWMALSYTKKLTHNTVFLSISAFMSSLVFLSRVRMC